MYSYREIVYISLNIPNTSKMLFNELNLLSTLKKKIVKIPENNVHFLLLRELVNPMLTLLAFGSAKRRQRSEAPNGALPLPFEGSLKSKY